MNALRGIQIRGIAIYHPKEIRDNNYFTSCYKEKEEFVRNITENTLGRDKRYVITVDSGETTVSMAIASSKKVLEQVNLQGQDIDLVCFCTMTPEFLSPPVSLIIHDAIEGKKEAFCYDLNANCAGMLYALDQVSKYMHCSAHVKRALLVGVECLSLVYSPEDIVNRVCYGDTACAVIVEKTEEESKIIDIDYYVESSFWNSAKSPYCGLSNIFNSDRKKLYYTLKPSQPEYERSPDLAREILRKHHLQVSDIKLFCITQSAKTIGEKFYNQLGVKKEQQIFVGDKYGYTGANSPFLCLYEGIKAGRVKRGDYVFMWTVGAAVQYIMLLIRY